MLAAISHLARCSAQQWGVLRHRKLRKELSGSSSSGGSSMRQLSSAGSDKVADLSPTVSVCEKERTGMLKFHGCFRGVHHTHLIQLVVTDPLIRVRQQTHHLG